MKNEEIATAFINGEEAKTPNGAFYVENINSVGVVFSYGNHFPIAIKFSDGFLFNKDGYSNTTARHKNLILALIKDDLTDEDYINTTDIKAVVDKIKYSDVKTKAELILNKI